MKHLRKFNEKIELEYPYVPGEMHLYGFREDDVVNGEGTNDILIPENIFLVNGYSVGGRVLEDVMFEITFKNKEVLYVEVEGNSSDYFEGLNTTRWLTAIRNHAQGILKYGDEVDLPERIMEKYNVESGFISNRTDIVK